MPGTFAKQELPTILARAKPQFDTYLVKLFVNDYLPTEDSAIGDFLEASWGGYNFFGAGPFGTADLMAGNIGRIQGVTNKWICSGPPFPQSCYGYFLVDSVGTYHGAERFT